MFSFFKKKSSAEPPPASDPSGTGDIPADEGLKGWIDKLRGATAASASASAPAVADTPSAVAAAAVPMPAVIAAPQPVDEAPPSAVHETPADERLDLAEEPVSRLDRWLDRLRGTGDEPALPTAPSMPEAVIGDIEPQPATEAAPAQATDRERWLDRLRGGLRRTGTGIAQVFTGAQVDDALYEELESALLMADAGVKATEHLLDDLKRRVREQRASDSAAVKALLVDALADVLGVLEKSLEVGRETPTVMMVAGVNGAGKTTTIGKLTRHLAQAHRKVLLAAADTFRAAAREQLAVWADRNHVEIVSQQGGDPAAVTFDAVIAGKARGCDVVIADTAGRLSTQAHLMEELKKIRRVIEKAQPGAPHEVLLVVDGNTGQNALAQVQAFDAALGLTGIVVTKLDGTAKGGVLVAIAMWSRERLWRGEPRVPVYFIGVGEKLEDLQTFDAREFAQALLS